MNVYVICQDESNFDQDEYTVLGTVVYSDKSTANRDIERYYEEYGDEIKYKIVEFEVIE